MDALDDLCTAADEAIRRLQVLVQRAEKIRHGRSAGHSYRELAAAEERPLIVEMLTDTLELLADSGAAWRRAEARALHEDGLTMDRIAALFGVTRQRISALLRPKGPAPQGG